jgi:alkanesulfonate monooxygenase SsuD/methylene tetrahydromethanopterin reductase-like flavin-dependent oxidoreductase (luciferase family)
VSGLHLAVALEGAGWHPAAWREPDARPGELFTAGYWADLVLEAERGLLDLVTLEDSFDPAPARTDVVAGRLDAVLIAARVAPLTSHIGLVPTAVVTHTEPFHLSKAIATLDYVSGGRAGVRVQVAPRADTAAQFGRRTDLTDLAQEAADYVEVLRRLWDSWEDDAEIRDVATGRFVDRDKLHYVDFEGRWFSVKGPSITPRPPQGQPVVAAPGSYGVAADVVLVAPDDVGAAIPGRHVFGDLVVFLDDTEAAARHRRHRLGPDGTDAHSFAGTPGQLADRLLEWQAAGLTGFRLRPAALPHDLLQVTRGLVPELQRRGAFRTAYEASTLRGLLGLPRPANRYQGVA